MNKDDIVELYFITHINNIPSVEKNGILCHKHAQEIEHYSIALEDIQNRREGKKIPGTKKELHDYANVYFDAHNPMLSSVRDKNDSICVLRVHKSILDIDGVIISDMNASRYWARFEPVAKGLELLDKDEVFAEFWLHDDNQIEQDRHKGVKCAEVLVPDLIRPDYIVGAYVANDKAKKVFKKASGLPVKIKQKIFF